MRKHLFLLGLVGSLLFFSGCYTVPETGRQSLILPIGDDVAEGAAAFAEVKSTEPISRDPVFNARVQRIGTRIAAAVGSDLPSAQWEFVVFDAPNTVNAFALPGGKVGVYTGLLALVETDDELAIVMGHEIGHVTARHGAERMSQGVLAGLLGAALDVSTQNSKNHDMVLLAYGLGAAGTTLKFSRDNESEADRIGIRYAAKAGYDPRAAITFWRKMEKAESGGMSTLLGKKLEAFLSTHPTHERRIADLEKLMPEALPFYETAKLRYK